MYKKLEKYPLFLSVGQWVTTLQNPPKCPSEFRGEIHPFFDSGLFLPPEDSYSVSGPYSVRVSLDSLVIVEIFTKGFGVEKGRGKKKSLQVKW